MSDNGVTSFMPALSTGLGFEGRYSHKWHVESVSLASDDHWLGNGGMWFLRFARLDFSLKHAVRSFPFRFRPSRFLGGCWDRLLAFDACSHCLPVGVTEPRDKVMSQLLHFLIPILLFEPCGLRMILTPASWVHCARKVRGVELLFTRVL
jgi:hypothetical protein